MSKVDWITWKTNPKEIINPNIIVENIENNFSDYNEYMSPLIYDQIKNEIENGILKEDCENLLKEFFKELRNLKKNKIEK